jgi:hypothetical protein
VYVVILVIICITVWFTYPETRGYTLEEIAVVFDGNNANIVASDKVLEAVGHHIDTKYTVQETENGSKEG